MEKQTSTIESYIMSVTSLATSLCPDLQSHGTVPKLIQKMSVTPEYPCEAGRVYEVCDHWYIFLPQQPSQYLVALRTLLSVRKLPSISAWFLWVLYPDIFSNCVSLSSSYWQQRAMMISSILWEISGGS